MDGLSHLKSWVASGNQSEVTEIHSEFPENDIVLYVHCDDEMIEISQNIENCIVCNSVAETPKKGAFCIGAAKAVGALGFG